MRFTDLTGQDEALAHIRNVVSHDRTPHAFLFHGRRGTGKTTAALALARTLQCRAPGPLGPCEACPACHKSLHFNHPDIFLVPPTPSAPDTHAGEAQRTDFITGAQADMVKEKIFLLDESRPLEHRIATMRWLKHEATRGAVDGPWKIFILKRAGEMNVESANAILKLLEEPNPGTILVLGVERPTDLPETIKSRCALVRFRDLSVVEITRLLGERLPDTPPEAVRLAARVARGSLTRAAALIGEEVTVLRDQAVALLTAAAADPGRHELLDPWLRSRDKGRLDLLFDLMLLWYGDLLRVMIGAPDPVEGLANEDRRADLVAWSRRIDPGQLRAAVRLVEEARASADGYGYVPLLLPALLEQVPRG